jgi:hypothetical protein
MITMVRSETGTMFHVGEGTYKSCYHSNPRVNMWSRRSESENWLNCVPWCHNLHLYRVVDASWQQLSLEAVEFRWIQGLHERVRDRIRYRRCTIAIVLVILSLHEKPTLRSGSRLDLGSLGLRVIGLGPVRNNFQSLAMRLIVILMSLLEKRYCWRDLDYWLTS